MHSHATIAIASMSGGSFRWRINRIILFCMYAYSGAIVCACVSVCLPLSFSNFFLSVFKLYKEPFKNDIIDAANLASPLYAFRLAGQKGDDKEEEAAESLHASHERAMTVARNFTRGVTVTTNNTGLVAEITDDLIQPADQIRDRMKQTATSGAIVVTQPSKPTAGVAVATMKSTTNGHTTGTKTKVPTTKVATTAASFFRTTSESTSRETSKQKNSSAGTQSTAPPASNTNGANTTSEKTSRRVTTQQSKTAKTQASTSRVLGKKVQSHSVEKENRADKVGNADDFVGDQDDDDSDDDSNDDSRMRSDGSDQDDDDSVPRIPKPPTKTMKTGDRKGMRQETAGQKKSKDPIPMEEEIEPRSEDEGGEVDDDNTNKIPTVTGAMDAFAVAKTEVRNGATALNGKRRVKKLVEKTVIDNGYFRTIMEEVWEEIPVDDQQEKSISLTKNKTSENKPPSVKAEAPPTKKKKTTAVGNGNAMKQGTLMAFFGKK